MESRVTGLLPIFSFLCPSVLYIRSVGLYYTGQTDGQTQTDHSHQCIMPHPLGAG